MTKIEPIGAAERHLAGLDFFLLWAGAAVSLAEIWAGGLLTPLGLASGTVVILLGHLIGNTPMALGSLLGSETGVSTMVAVRPAFGLRGSYFPTLLNMIQLIGWTGVMLWIGAQAAESAWPFPRWGCSGWVVASGLVTTAWAMIGRRYWKWLQRVAVSTLLLLCLHMTHIVFGHYGWRQLLLIQPRGPSLPFMIGLDLVIAMPISWLPLVCDYSRYATGARGAFWGTWLGYLVVSSWMYLIGLAVSLATQTSTPDSMVLDLMIRHGQLAPAVVIILISTLTTTFLDIYSTAVSILNIRPGFSERLGSAVCGLLGIGLALIFPASAYEDFLLLVGSAFCPLFGVVLTDFFLLDRGRYRTCHDPEELSWCYFHGFNLNGFLAWGIGCAIYQLLRPTLWGSSLPSLLLAGLLYWLLMKRSLYGERTTR